MNNSTTNSEAVDNRPAVLVVDDEHEFLNALTASLSGRFDIDISSSAEEAELQASTKHYDVIICDHMLPGEQGLNFLMRMRQRFPGTKRILITGYTNPDFLARCIGLADLGACLLKPVRAEEIIASVSKILKR